VVFRDYFDDVGDGRDATLVVSPQRCGNRKLQEPRSLSLNLTPAAVAVQSRERGHFRPSPAIDVK
jgi:hypothetical protein